MKVYIGETSRSAHERGGEHEADYKKKKPDSHMLKHQQADHSDQTDAKFQFRISATFQSALTRQITEAVMIRRQGEGCILNSKGVYNRCSLPRLTVLDDRKDDKESAPTSSSLEFDSDRWLGTRGWDKKRLNQPDVQNRRRMKKLKLDHQALSEDNPRQEGLKKRKICLETDHERECKRLRPEFEPEQELRSLTEELKPTTIQISKPIHFFNIFDKSNEKLLQKKMFNQPKKSVSKAKLTPRNKKKSLTTDATQQGSDIRSYLKQNRSQTAVTAVVKTVAQLPQLLEQLEGGKEESNPKMTNRGEESGVNWDPGL